MEINLIPKQEGRKPEVRLVIIKNILISFLTVFLVFSFLGIRYLVNMVKINDIKNKENSLNSREDELKDFKENLEKYRNHKAIYILNKHVYYTKVLKKIKEITPSTVKRSELTLNEGLQGTISGEIVGGYSYMEITRFLSILRKNNFSDPRLTSMTSSDSSIAFSITFKFPQELIL